MKEQNNRAKKVSNPESHELAIDSNVKKTLYTILYLTISKPKSNETYM